MEIRWTVLLVVIGGAVVTFIPRVIPLMVLSRIKLPEIVMQWLFYVPIAILAALVGQALFIDNEEVHMKLTPKLLAAVPTALVAIKTCSLLWTVVVGVVAFVLLQLLF